MDQFEQEQGQEQQQQGDNLDTHTPGTEEQSQGEQTQAGQGGDQGAQEEFDVVIAGETPAQAPTDEFNGQPAPQWVKDVRNESRESKKRIKELEAQLAEKNKTQEVELGEKPTIESVGYDADEYEVKLAEWFERKRLHESQVQQKQAEQERAAQEWQNRLTGYETKKSAIKSKVKDFDEAEELARDTLSQTQQGILIHAADNPELLIYHLGKNPEKAKQLAGITDPIQFAFAAAKIDSQIKVQTRRPQTSPETKPAGSSPLSGAVDNKLEELEAEADRTGDRSAVIAYKKSLRK